MRDIPKQLVASYVHAAGLVPTLALAASTGEVYSPAAVALLDAIMDPAITAIDLDMPEYQQGVAVLVGYGVIQQSHVDAIEALYVAPEIFTFTAIVNGTFVFTGDRGTQQSVPATAESSTPLILERMNRG